MAIQKHNIYYDASKPESGIYYYAENGEQKELFLNNVLSGENGISAISAVGGNTWVIGITDDYKDNIEKIPGLSDNFVILSADVGNKLYVSATDNWDVLPYSGSTNISIQDHIIDFQNTANLIGDGTHIDVISSGSNIVVKALKDFVDEEYVDDAIASSVSGKFDSSAFNTYSGIIDNKIDKLSNDFNNKLDISATNNWDISAYIAGNHISIADHIISIEDAKNLSGDEKNITVLETDDAFVISGLKDFVDKEYVDDAIASAAPTSAVANKLDKAVFSAYSADIALQLNNISADKLDTSAFTEYSAHALDDYYKKTETYNKQEIQNALDEKQDNLTNEQLSAISSVSAIQSISANWLTEEDIEDFITEDEVESVSSILTAQTNYLSGIIDTKLDKTEFDTYTATALDDYYTKDETKGLINDLSGTVSSQLNNKLDTSTFAAYSGNINNQINTVSSEVDKKLYTSATNDWDVTPYSGINGIKVENHLISVSANYALSADVYSKSQIDDIIANFGGFQIVSEDAQGKPDVSDPSTKIIYLTLVDDDPAAFDKYREWIWTNSEWECIGIASIDLKDYAKTQDVITSAVATSAWINNTFYNKTETSGKTEIQNALDTKLDITAFDNYSDNIDEQLQTLSSIKLDKSVFSAYSAEINTELNNITADVDKKLYTSATDNWDYIAYSGGQNVSVVDHIIDISGTKSLSGDGKNIEVVELADTFIISATKDIADKSYVDDNFVSKTDFGTYSGNTKNQIDSKLDISVFTAYSAHALDNYYTKDETSGKSEIQNALDEKQDNLSNEQLSAISSVSAIQSNTENWNAAYDTLTAYSADGKWLIADDITALATKNEVEIASGVLTAQTNYLSGIIDTKLDTTAFDTYTATALNDYYKKSETDNLIDDLSATVDNRLTNKLDTSAFTAYSADVKMQIDSKLNKNDFDSYSADVKTQIDSKLATADFTAYSGNINNLITSVSANTTALSANKLDTTAFTAYTATALNDYYKKSETDTEITNAITDISATVSSDYLKKADVQEYTAGNNIDITNYVISGRDWTPELNTKVNNIDFTAYSADIKTQIDSKLNKSDFDSYSAIIDDDIDYLSAAIEDSILSVGTDLKIENGIISVNTNGIVENSADMSFVAGSATYASGIGAAAFGYASSAVDDYAFADGIGAKAIGVGSHAEGIGTKAIGEYSHTEGINTSATNKGSHAEGQQTLASGYVSHSEGYQTTASGYASHAEGYNTSALYYASHAEGDHTVALGYASHAEGTCTQALSMYSHSEGLNTTASGQQSHAEGAYTLAQNNYTHTEGYNTSAIGYTAHAEGDSTFASGNASHTEGQETSANYGMAHAEGVKTLASGYASHTEGSGTRTNNSFAHAEGYGTSAISAAAHAEGWQTSAAGIASHAEGSATSAIGSASYAGGYETLASGNYSHAEGVDTKAAGEESHAEGWGTVASGHNSHAEGNYTTAVGVNSHAEGYQTSATGYVAHAEGYKTSAMGQYTHTEGQNTIANNDCAHAEGQQTSALAMQTHAEGGWTLANNNCAHAEGFYTKALGYASHVEGQFTNAATAFAHAEGNGTSAIGIASHAEGAWTVANHDYSHTEGQNTSALGAISHAEGSATVAEGAFAHAEGSNTSAIGDHSHAEGQNTIANSYAMHAGGMYNETSADALYVIGNGTADDARSDAFIITSAGLASATILATSGIPDIEAAINNIPAQVQSDWEETDTTSPAYIQNKPDDLEMSAGNGISITEVNDTLIFSVSGKLDTTAFNDYSAEIDNDIDYISGAIEDSCVKYNDIQYAIGTANTAIGSTTTRYSVALGNSNSAYNSFVIGNYNKGKESHIFGNSNSGINSYIVGNSCTGTESYLFGKELSGKSWGIELGDFGDTGYPVIVGSKNATKTSAYFVVGCGNTLGNADAFIVSSNKVASAADFKAGNGVSLSSLTGLSQVQADWDETVTSNPAYIQNKPDVLIPVDSPAALGGISKPTNIMVVSALPASPDSATIYLVQGTMIGN